MEEPATQMGAVSQPARTFFRLSADGGIEADPPGQPSGEAAIGVVLRNPKGSLVHKVSERIGWAKDHHVAEYKALIRGLELARDQEIEHLRIFLDSALVVQQVNGDWQVKAEHLKPLCRDAQTLVKLIRDLKICWVPREMNPEAHELADEALGR